MMSQGSLTAYFWGAYAWFCLGALAIGIPAIREFFKLLKK